MLESQLVCDFRLVCRSRIQSGTGFEGEFRMGNGQFCEPLTVTAHASRIVLVFEVQETTVDAGLIQAFQT